MHEMHISILCTMHNMHKCTSAIIGRLTSFKKIICMLHVVSAMTNMAVKRTTALVNTHAYSRMWSKSWMTKCVTNADTKHNTKGQFM